MIQPKVYYGVSSMLRHTVRSDIVESTVARTRGLVTLANCWLLIAI